MGYNRAATVFVRKALRAAEAVCILSLLVPAVSQAEELQPPREILRYSEPKADSEQLEEPPDVFMRENIPYELASWEIAEGGLPGRMQYGESTVVYEKIGMNAEIPKTAEISIEGEDGLFSVPLVQSEYTNERWENDFSFTLTFHSCQADIYELGGVEIFLDSDSEQPRLWGYEDELLELIGLPQESYRITGYKWAGEPYWDETGLLCRDAAAKGQRLVRDCKAVYGGEVILPPRETYRTKAVYRLKERERAEKTGSEEKRTGGESRQTESLEPAWSEEIRRVIKRFTAVTIRFGLLFLLIVLLRLMFRTGRAVWERWGSRKR